MGPGDLTDEQWAALEPLLPKVAGAGRSPVRPRRQLTDGIRFRVRTGVPWRGVPAEHGPRSRVHDLFRRWQRDGTWQRILTRLQSLADAKSAITWDLSVDSTVCRAHQHAAGAHKQGGLRKEPADQARNRQKLGSRGGRPPKSDLTDCRERHAVECGINRLKRHRAAAARHDKLAVRYEATVLIAAVDEWL